MRLPCSFVAPIALMAVLAACGSQTSGEIAGDDGEAGEYVINQETGEASATITTEDGTVTTRSGSDVPVDLPGGFTVYPDAKVLSNTIVTQGGGSGALVTMSSSDSPEEVAAFYREQAEKAGIELQMELNTNGGKLLGGESKDGLTFSLAANPSEEDGSIVQLTLGKDQS